MSTNN